MPETLSNPETQTPKLELRFRVSGTKRIAGFRGVREEDLPLCATIWCFGFRVWGFGLREAEGGGLEFRDWGIGLDYG